MKKVYAACGFVGYCNWLENMGFEVVRHPDEANLLMLAGGTDIGSHLYGQKPGVYTDNPHKTRDEIEVMLYNDFVNSGRAVWGTCRGWQLVTALNGGKLVQHSRHPSGHSVYIPTQENQTPWEVTSCHHQQALLSDLKEGEDYILEAWTQKLSPFHLGPDNLDYGFNKEYKEPEMGAFPKTKVAGAQGHPEWADMNGGFVKYCQMMVEKYLL